MRTVPRVPQNFIDTAVHIGYSYSVLPSTVAWLFLVL